MSIEQDLLLTRIELAEKQRLLKAEIEAHGATITREAQLSLKLEAAEARIKASQEQEPVKENELYPVGTKFYAAPVIPPDVAELQRELHSAELYAAHVEEKNAELTRKLAEQQAVIVSVREYGRQHCVDVWNICVAHDNDNTAELTKLLAEAKSKAVPEGWKLVPKKPTAEMLEAGRRRFYHTPCGHWEAMFAASPQPGGSNDRS